MTAVVLVSCVRQVWRFNVRMPELWRLLESKERAHRVRELRDEPRTNLPSAKYLYDEVDFDDLAPSRDAPLQNLHQTI